MIKNAFCISAALFLCGCEIEEEVTDEALAEEVAEVDTLNENEGVFYPEEYSSSTDMKPLCDGNFISVEAAEKMLELTTLTNSETVYTIYDRIDGIATLFEDCNDPWGMFPTTYRHITNRIIEAIEKGEIEDQQWGRDIVLDFASRYMENLQLALLGEEPSYAWNQYYYLADHPEASRTRAVVVAMVAHLTLDLPHSLVAIGTTEDHKDDYFVLGELMIETADHEIIKRARGLIT